MSEPIYRYTFSVGTATIVTYNYDLESAKRSALVSCEYMARALDRELDYEESGLLVEVRPVKSVEIREAP